MSVRKWRLSRQDERRRAPGTGLAKVVARGANKAGEGSGAPGANRAGESGGAPGTGLAKVVARGEKRVAN